MPDGMKELLNRQKQNFQGANPRTSIFISYATPDDDKSDFSVKSAVCGAGVSRALSHLKNSCPAAVICTLPRRSSM